mgnify:CR=1 FL=1
MDKVDTSRQHGSGEAPKIRRPYTTPTLIEYGSVAKLTQGSGSMPPGDGGSTMLMR